VVLRRDDRIDREEQPEWANAYYTEIRDFRPENLGVDILNTVIERTRHCPQRTGEQHESEFSASRSAPFR